MPILRSIKNEYTFFHHQKHGIIIALDAENRERLALLWKKIKGKKHLSGSPQTVNGYKMVNDEEFHSLKIDFSELHQFDAAELKNAKFE